MKSAFIGDYPAKLPRGRPNTTKWKYKLKFGVHWGFLLFPDKHRQSASVGLQGYAERFIMITEFLILPVLTLTELTIVQRHRLPPGSWVRTPDVRTRPLLRPTGSIPLVDPAMFWKGVGDAHILLSTHVHNAWSCKHLFHFTTRENCHRHHDFPT